MGLWGISYKEKTSTMGMGVKTAWLCLKKNIVGEVPQDCVDLIYGNQ